MITPVLINRLDWKTYLIFMCTNLAFVPIIYFMYPETSNMSLEAIDSLFIKPGEYDSESAEEGEANRGVKASEVTTETVAKA